MKELSLIISIHCFLLVRLIQLERTKTGSPGSTSTEEDLKTWKPFLCNNRTRSWLSTNVTGSAVSHRVLWPGVWQESCDNISVHETTTMKP
jgi:hypothetical protein